jgi:hypothetical protein
MCRYAPVRGSLGPRCVPVRQDSETAACRDLFEGVGRGGMRVKRLVEVGFVLFSLLLSSQQAAGADDVRTFSPKTHYYVVEYQKVKAVANTRTADAVLVTFFLKVSGRQAEAVTRARPSSSMSKKTRAQQEGSSLTLIVII